MWERTGDNGSAFIFRLHPRAKSAMAEILVSDLYDCRPPTLMGGIFVSWRVTPTRPRPPSASTLPNTRRFLLDTILCATCPGFASHHGGAVHPTALVFCLYFTSTAVLECTPGMRHER